MYKYNCHIYGSVPHFFHIFTKTECLFNPWHISSIPMLKNHTLFTSSLKISVLFLIVQQKFSFYNCLEFSESKSENKREIVESLCKKMFSTVLYYFLMKITKSLFQIQNPNQMIPPFTDFRYFYPEIQFIPRTLLGFHLYPNIVNLSEYYLQSNPEKICNFNNLLPLVIPLL